MFSRRNLFAAPAFLAAATVPAVATGESATGDHQAWIDFLTKDVRTFLHAKSEEARDHLWFKMEEAFVTHFGKDIRTYRIGASGSIGPRTIHFDPKMVTKDVWSGVAPGDDYAYCGRLSLPIAVVYDNGEVTSVNDNEFYAISSVDDFVSSGRTPVDVPAEVWKQIRLDFLRRARERHDRVSRFMNEVS